MQERKWGKNVRIDQRRRVAAREALEHEFDELVLIDDAAVAPNPPDQP